MDRAHMRDVPPAHQHNGAAFVEVLQELHVFNDGAFEKITSRDARASMLIRSSTANRSCSAPRGPSAA